MLVQSPHVDLLVVFVVTNDIVSYGQRGRQDGVRHVSKREEWASDIYGVSMMRPFPVYICRKISSLTRLFFCTQDKIADGGRHAELFQAKRNHAVPNVALISMDVHQLQRSWQAAQGILEISASKF